MVIKIILGIIVTCGLIDNLIFNIHFLKKCDTFHEKTSTFVEAILESTVYALAMAYLINQ